MADETTDQSDILIEGSTATWEMNLDGSVLGTHRGRFKFKCYLTPTEIIAAGRSYRELLGTNPALASEHESFLAYALTQLKYRIIEAPPFWATSKDGIQGDLPDTEIVSAVLDAAISAELKFKGQLAKRKKDALDKAIKEAEKLSEGKEEVTSESED